MSTSLDAVPCWCDEDVPPFSVLMVRNVLNPSAMQTPTLVVNRPRVHPGISLTQTVVGRPGSARVVTFNYWLYHGRYNRPPWDYIVFGKTVWITGVQDASPQVIPPADLTEITDMHSFAEITAKLSELTTFLPGDLSITGEYVNDIPPLVRVFGILQHGETGFERCTVTITYTGRYAEGDDVPSLVYFSSIDGWVPFPFTPGTMPTNTAYTFHVFQYEPESKIVLTVNGKNSSEFVPTVSPSELQSVLEAVSGVGVGQVSVSGSVGSYNIVFTGSLTGTNVQVTGVISDGFRSSVAVASDVNVAPDSVTEYYQWPVVYHEGFYATNLRLYVLTNGMHAVPAKTIFYAKHLLHGVHWMRYDENHATPTHPWFYPRDDSWFLVSTNSKESFGQSKDQLQHRVHGVVFRRIGRADTINKCVPVVMAISNFQVDYDTRVA